jgi:hypothetical protein
MPLNTGNIFMSDTKTNQTTNQKPQTKTMTILTNQFKSPTAKKYGATLDDLSSLKCGTAEYTAKQQEIETLLETIEGEAKPKPQTKIMNNTKTTQVSSTIYATPLTKAIAFGVIKVTILKGGDSRICPKCRSNNAMCLRGEIPAGFEQHELWKSGLDAYACRDCGHSTISQMNGDTWTNETTHALFIDGEQTGDSCRVSNSYSCKEQEVMVHQILHRQIDEACKSSDDVETRAIHNGHKSYKTV